MTSSLPPFALTHGSVKQRSAVVAYASCRVVVIFRYLSAWKNKHLPAEERAARAAWGQAVATVGAIAGTKLTGGAEPALASQDSATERA